MRSGLENLCTTCRLRLHGAVGRCPFCWRETLGVDHSSRSEPLARASWDLTLGARVARWAMLVSGALSMLPAPLVVVVLPIALLVFGTPSDLAPDSFVPISVVIGPALFLALGIVFGMLIPTLALVFAVVVGIGEALVTRRTVDVCARDREPLGEETFGGRVDEKLAALEGWVARLGRWTKSGRVIGTLAVVVASSLLVVSSVLRDERLQPWTAALVGVAGVLVLAFAGSLWASTVLQGIAWIRGGAGLSASLRERGGRRFDGDREAREMLAHWTTGRTDGRGRGGCAAAGSRAAER